MSQSAQQSSSNPPTWPAAPANLPPISQKLYHDFHVTKQIEERDRQQQRQHSLLLFGVPASTKIPLPNPNTPQHPHHIPLDPTPILTLIRNCNIHITAMDLTSVEDLPTSSRTPQRPSSLAASRHMQHSQDSRPIVINLVPSSDKKRVLLQANQQLRHQGYQFKEYLTPQQRKTLSALKDQYRDQFFSIRYSNNRLFAKKGKKRQRQPPPAL